MTTLYENIPYRIPSLSREKVSGVETFKRYPHVATGILSLVYTFSL